MELTIENLRTLAQGGQIFLTSHSQARLYERGILLADIRQAIQSGKIIEYRPDDYRCPSCLVLGVNLAGRKGTPDHQGSGRHNARRPSHA